MFEFDEKVTRKDEATYHFVAYVPINGRLYELDGLKEGPVDLGKCDQDDWLKDAKPILDKRIQRWAVLLFSPSSSSHLLPYSPFLNKISLLLFLFHCLLSFPVFNCHHNSASLLE